MERNVTVFTFDEKCVSQAEGEREKTLKMQAESDETGRKRK